MSESRRAVAPSVSVVVPVLDEEERLDEAVESILAQRYEGRLDVCLAVGPSRDRTLEVARALAVRHPGVVTVVDNPTGRTPEGLNIAIAATTGEVVVRVDAHSRLPAGYVATAVEVLEETGAVNVGGRQNPVGPGGTSRAIARAMTNRFGTGGAKFHVGGEAGPVDTVYLGVFRRAAGDSVGWFDPRLVRNQDYELNIRLRAAGGTVWFDPRLAVDYVPRDSIRRLARQYLEYGTWKAQVARMHPGSLRPRQVVPAAVTAAIATSLLAAVWAPGLLVLPALYASTVVVAAALTGRSFDERARLLVVYPVLHLAWGAGFLASIPRRRVRGVRGAPA